MPRRGAWSAAGILISSTRIILTLSASLLLYIAACGDGNTSRNEAVRLAPRFSSAKRTRRGPSIAVGRIRSVLLSVRVAPTFELRSSRAVAADGIFAVEVPTASDVHRHRPCCEQRSHRRRDRRESACTARSSPTLQSEHASVRRRDATGGSGRGSYLRHHPARRPARRAALRTIGATATAVPSIVDAMRSPSTDRVATPDADVDAPCAATASSRATRSATKRDRQTAGFFEDVPARARYVCAARRTCRAMNCTLNFIMQPGGLLVLTGPRRRGNRRRSLGSSASVSKRGAGAPSFLILRYSLKSS